MNVLSQEVRNIQNPAIGAGLLWRYSCGYTQGHQHQAPAPIPLLFLVLPIVFNEDAAAFVRGTQKASGLRAFAAKFGEAKASKQDLLLAIHERASVLRRLTLDSLRLALVTRLLFLNTDGTVIPLSNSPAVAGLPGEVRELMRDSEKLGFWCSQVSLHETATTLKVRF